MSVRRPSLEYFNTIVEEFEREPRTVPVWWTSNDEKMYAKISKYTRVPTRDSRGVITVKNKDIGRFYIMYRATFEFNKKYISSLEKITKPIIQKALSVSKTKSEKDNMTRLLTNLKETVLTVKMFNNRITRILKTDIHRSDFYMDDVDWKNQEHLIMLSSH